MTWVLDRTMIVMRSQLPGLCTEPTQRMLNEVCMYVQMLCD